MPGFVYWLPVSISILFVSLVARTEVTVRSRKLSFLVRRFHDKVFSIVAQEAMGRIIVIGLKVIVASNCSAVRYYLLGRAVYTLPVHSTSIVRAQRVRTRTGTSRSVI